MGEGEKGVIEETEKDMIRNILDFNDTCRETMTHRTDIGLWKTALQSKKWWEDPWKTAAPGTGLHEDIDTVVGICYVEGSAALCGQEVPSSSRSQI